MIESGPLKDSVCVQSVLKQISFLFLWSQSDSLIDFIKDAGYMFVSPIAICRVRTNCCKIVKLVEELIVLVALKVLFKKRGAESMLNSRSEYVLESSRREEIEDHE